MDAVETLDTSFGRPQGLAFDAGRHAARRRSARGVERGLSAASTGRALVVAGPRLVGLAFGPAGNTVVATSDSVYRFEAAT